MKQISIQILHLDYKNSIQTRKREWPWREIGKISLGKGATEHSQRESASQLEESFQSCRGDGRALFDWRGSYLFAPE